MRALLRDLGDPQTAFRSIHVVGSNGKTTTTLMIEAILRGEGLSVGATTSPHVRSWAERLSVGDFERAVERVRPAAERVGATQFEVAIAAAFSEFAAVGVDAAVVEAGLGGRLDATNVIDAPVVVLTNVSLEHTDVLGPTREAIAAEKLAVVRPGATVVLSEPEWEGQARARGAGAVKLAGGSSVELAEAAAEAFLGRAVDPSPASEVHLPGRLEQRGNELWDGAHNPAGIEWLVERLPAAALRGRRLDPERQGRGRHARGRSRAWPTASSSRARAIRARFRPTSSLRWRRSRQKSSRIPPRRSSARASWRARTAPFSSRARSTSCKISPSSRARTMARLGEQVSVFAFATVVVAVIVALAFAAGYLFGKMLL